MHRFILFVFLFLISCSDDYSQIKFEDDTELPQVVINLNTSIEYLSKEFYSEATIEIKSKLQSQRLQSKPILLRGRGNSTWSFAKKPYQLKFNEDIEILGMPEARKWVLLAPYSDKSLLRTEVAFSLSRYGVIGWTPTSKFIELFINQEYLGVYQLVEKIEATESRLNEGKGFVLEVNRQNRIGPGDVYFNSYNDCCNYYTIKDPKVEFGDSNFTFIKSYINEVETTLFGEDFIDPENGYSKYIDVESFIDWFIVHEITKESESAWGSSCYLNYGEEEKLMMGPVWDFDVSLGNDYNEDGSIEGFTGIKDKGWYARLFQDSVFVENLKNRFRYYYLNRDNFLSEIDANAYYLYDAQTRNFTKWPILGVWVWPNATNFPEYSHEVSYLKEWFKNRMDWLNEEIENL